MNREEYITLRDRIIKTSKKDRLYDEHKKLLTTLNLKGSPQQKAAITKILRRVEEDLEELDMNEAH